MKKIDYKKLENLVIQPGMENKLIPLALYKGSVPLGDVHRRWNFSIAMMLAEAETIYDARALWADPTLAKLCFWNVKQPPSPMHLGSWLFRLADNKPVVQNVSGLWEFVEHWWAHAGKYRIQLTRVPRTTSYTSKVPWRVHEKKDRKWRPRRVKADPYEISYPFLIHKPDKAGNNQGYDLLWKINKAVGPLPREIKADVCQDLAVAILSGDMDESELDGNVKDFVRKVYQMFPTKYGPISLDATVPGTDGVTYLDMLAGNGYAV